jgi:hypothetical protein
MKRQLHLNLFIHGRGHHEAAWRHPAASPLALTDISYYTDLRNRDAADRDDRDGAAGTPEQIADIIEGWFHRPPTPSLSTFALEIVAQVWRHILGHTVEADTCREARPLLM